MFNEIIEDYDAEFAWVRIGYQDELANPREDEAIGTLLAHCQGYTLGDDDSELKGEWDYVVDLYSAYRQGWSLGAALARREICEDSGMVSFPDNSGEMKPDVMPDYCVLIPVNCGAGSYSWCRTETPIVGREACFEYIGQVLDGVEQPSGMYVITLDDVHRYFGEVNGETIKQAADVAEWECRLYDAYLKGEIYAYSVCTPDGEREDSGDYYLLDECQADAERAALWLDSQFIAKEKQEADEVDYWSQRDVITV